MVARIRCENRQEYLNVCRNFRRIDYSLNPANFDQDQVHSCVCSPPTSDLPSFLVRIRKLRGTT
jgi:hypothetical protein